MLLQKVPQSLTSCQFNLKVTNLLCSLDFDPEDIDDGGRSDAGGSSVASDEAGAGREHYESVG